MNASHKPLERIKKILDFLKEQIEQNPDVEAFTLGSGQLSNFHALLQNSELVQFSFDQIREESKENIKIEFRQSPSGITTVTDGTVHEVMVWFYVADNSKFKEYRNEIARKLEREMSARNFILDSDGFFYPEGVDKKHQLEKDSDRYQLLYFLAKEKEYVATKEISEKLDMPVPRVRKVVDEIRNIVVKKWELPRSVLFESDNVSGYRVTNVNLK
ncbi:MAG TPA: hypothetical protein VGE63_00180 [Candidatus Paceibacterota bacterium]